MQTTIRPSLLTGMIQAPASKSSMQRACAAALLSRGETEIRNPGHSNDDKAALGVIRDLGAEIIHGTDRIRVKSDGVRPVSARVNCGESGLGIRMFAPLIALSNESITVNGEGSLLSRPMDFFDEVFPSLGIQVKSNEGKLPLQIQGPLRPKNITIDGSLSSQFLTGLLFAYAAAGAGDVTITVNNLKSKPYIDLTLQVIRHFGWQVENRNYAAFYFPGKAGAPAGDGKSDSNAGDEKKDDKVTAGDAVVSRSYTVEGDWSGAAFLLVAGAIAGPITIKGLDLDSTQADKAIIKALEDCGAALVRRGEELEIGPAGTGPLNSASQAGPTGAGALQAFRFDATDCPDLFPPLAALASYCEGTTVIQGVSRLAHKESNRGLTLQDEFGKMGVSIRLEGDYMLISGGAGVKGASVHSRHDHRIAMACAVAGLRAGGPTVIAEAEAINKSYPDFYDHIRQLGAGVEIR